MKRILLLAVVLGTFPATGATQEFALMGVGAQTCGQFANLYRRAPNAVETTYFSWAQGYMSGINMMRVGTDGASQNMASISVEAQQRMLREYCNERPLADFIEAVNHLYWKFSASRPTKKRAPPQSN